MIVTTVGTFIDETLRYVNEATDGEVIEVILRNGKTLQLKLKDKEEE